MTNYKTISRSVTLLTLILFSVLLFSGAGVAASVPNPDSSAYPLLANEDTIVDPRGQTVKENQRVEMGRSVKLDLIQPVDWSLEVLGQDIISAQIPMDLDLNLGLTFPVDAETSYDPYDVHAGSALPFVVDLSNDGCYPYATVGIDFLMDFAGLNFDFLGLGNLLGFAADWGKIDYSASIDIPFYGINTKLGNWLSYDILDKYYSLDDLLSISLSDYGIAGGVGVNVQYNLYSYITAKVDSTSSFGDQSATLTWNDFGSQIMDLNINGAATHGDIYTVTVGDFVYHIAHDVTFTIWADIGLDVLGLNIIDETFDYSKTLGLGQLTFPGKKDYTFVSHPQVLAGTSVHGVDASWSAIDFQWGPAGGTFSAFDYDVDIPHNDKIQEFFTDMNIDAGIGASIDIDFPFNMLSYYNARKVSSGNTFDYNLLMDSIGADAPHIEWNVDGFIDLSEVSILGMSLDRYEFATGGELFSLSDIVTPFGTETAEIEVTSLIQLDTASELLNEYIADMCYGINPDIQFQAWVVLQLDGYMTGNVVVTGANVVSSTPFVWNEQFDTQTTRIQVPSSLDAGETFTVTCENLVYHMKVTPGIKLGVSVLGGIVAFDYTFLIPGVSQYLQKTFAADNFQEIITVQDLGVDAYDLTINDPSVAMGDSSVSGSFKFKNVGTVNDNFNVELVTDNLPSGASASGFTAYHSSVTVGGIRTISYTVNLGSGAHGVDYIKNSLAFKVSSATDSAVFDIVSGVLNIAPDPSLIDTDVTMESAVTVEPGVGCVVPVLVENNGKISMTYGISVVGADTALLGIASFGLAAGASIIKEFIIDVPAESASAAGEFGVTVTITQSGASNIVKTLTYTVPDFVLFGMNIDLANPADEVITVGATAEFTFLLSNNGNIGTDIDISIDGIAPYKINSALGAQNIILASGASGVACVASFETLTPGEKTFTVIASIDGVTQYTQSFTINVIQVQVALQPVSGSDYEWQTGDGDLLYDLVVKNLGIVSDAFAVEIVGLDASAYTIGDLSDVNIFGLGTFSTTLSINPSDMTKVRGGDNAIGVQVTSELYTYTSIINASGVILPSFYQFALPTAGISSIQNDVVYDLTFTIVNEGNVLDLFDIEVLGIEGMTYEIVCDSMQKDSIFVAHGAEIEVTVRVAKSIAGHFYPTVNVINSDEVLLSSINGDFFTGFLYSPAFIVLIVGIIAAVAASLVFYGLYSNGVILTGYRSQTAEKLRLLKNRASVRLQEHKRTSEIKDTHKAIRDAEKPKVLKETAFDKLGDKISQKQEEKKKLRDLAKDESFWDDSNPASKDHFSFDE
jgi:hypothetical protein